MKIVHLLPFCPQASGLYECARDFMLGDIQNGHTVCAIDTDTDLKSDAMLRYINKHDNRGGFDVVTASHLAAIGADVLVVHQSIDPDVMSLGIPFVWVMHGRPLYMYRRSQFEKYDKFNLFVEQGAGRNLKGFVSLRKEHHAIWRLRICQPPNDALKVWEIDHLPISSAFYNPNGPKFPLLEKEKGTVNILIADSPREDRDAWVMAWGAILFAKNNGGKVHFASITTPIQPVWDGLLASALKLGVLGHVWTARSASMPEVYRACDVLVTPHVGGPRVIGEAILSGMRVVAANGSEYTPHTCDPEWPENVEAAISRAMSVPADCSAAKFFDTKACGEKMTKVYEEIKA